MKIVGEHHVIMMMVYSSVFWCSFLSDKNRPSPPGSMKRYFLSHRHRVYELVSHLLQSFAVFKCINTFSQFLFVYLFYFIC